ncbi:MAG: hypothetical protein D3917_18780, partial [Candidatus Electrothrix sp. AX5]|nr:hypothetical protein [Candidatus Electrothrix sp. AX5]
SAPSSYEKKKAEADSVNSIAVSSDGKFLLAINESGNVTLWDVFNLPDIRKVKNIGQDERYNSWDSFVFAPDNSALALVKSDQSIDVWNLKELTVPPIRLIGHAGSVRSVDFSPDSKRVVTGDSDQTIKIWDAQTGRELLSLDSEVGPVLSVRFSPRGDAVVSTHWQDDYRRVSVWKTASDARIHVETIPAEERRKFYDESAKIREYILKFPDGKDLPYASEIHRQYVAEQLLREAVSETSQQEYSQSITKARAAIALYPNLTHHPEDFLSRFSLISVQKNKSKALELVKRASELSDGSGEEDLPKAIALSNEALSLYPQFSDGYFKRGIALFRSGDIKGAEEDWLKTIEFGSPSPFDLRVVDNGFESAHYNLACIYSVKSSRANRQDERSRYTDKAISYLKIALKGGVAVNNVMYDSDLDAIRDDSRFQELLKQFKTN